MKFVFPEQEYDQWTADGELIFVPQKVFIDGHAIDARSVSTSKVADGKLLALGHEQTVATGQGCICNAEIVGRLPSDRDVSLAKGKDVALKRPRDTYDSGIHLSSRCALAHLSGWSMRVRLTQGMRITNRWANHAPSWA